MEHFNRHCDVACTIYSIVLQILIVSSLVNKKTYRQHTQDVPINNLFFSSVLIIFIILLSGLTFLPDLMLGPIGERLFFARIDKGGLENGETTKIFESHLVKQALKTVY